MANAKSDIITQIREMVSQCDLTLKAVSSGPNRMGLPKNDALPSLTGGLFLPPGDGELVPAPASPGCLSPCKQPEPV